MTPPAGRARCVITPEGLAMPLVLASRGSRVGALALDLAFIGLAMLAATIGLGLLGLRIALGRNGGGALQFVGIVWIAAIFVARNAWFLGFELSPRGATPGKRIAGIRIVARDGARLTAEMVIARNLLREIELLVPLALVGLFAGEGWIGGLAALGWLLLFPGLPLWNADRLRPGDVVGGTWVVEAPRPALGRVMQAGGAYRFGAAELAVYGEHELKVLEAVLRAGGAEPMAAVARTIAGKIGWHAPGADEVRPFLEAYYTQLRARLEAGMRFGRRKADKFAKG